MQTGTFPDLRTGYYSEVYNRTVSFFSWDYHISHWSSQLTSDKCPWNFQSFEKQTHVLDLPGSLPRSSDLQPWSWRLQEPITFSFVVMVISPNCWENGTLVIKALILTFWLIRMLAQRQMVLAIDVLFSAVKEEDHTLKNNGKYFELNMWVLVVSN